MFDPNTHGEWLPFQRQSRRCHPFEDVPGTVPRGEDHCLSFQIPIHQTDAAYPAIWFLHDAHHPLSESDLTAACHNPLPHRRNDGGQFVRSNVRVGVDEDIGVGPVFHEPAEDLAPSPALLRSRVQFAIGIGPCPPFPETIIRIGIDAALPNEFHEISSSLADRLTALQDYRPDTKFDQSQGAVEPRGAGTHNDD